MGQPGSGALPAPGPGGLPRPRGAAARRMTPCNVLVAAAAAAALPGAAASCRAPRSRLRRGSPGCRPRRGCGTRAQPRAPRGAPAARPHDARRAAARAAPAAAAAARAPGRARRPRPQSRVRPGAAARARARAPTAAVARPRARERHPDGVRGAGGRRRRRLQQQRRRPGDPHLQPAPRPAHPEGGRDSGVRLHRAAHRLPAAARLQVGPAAPVLAPPACCRRAPATPARTDAPGPALQERALSGFSPDTVQKCSPPSAAAVTDTGCL